MRAGRVVSVAAAVWLGAALVLGLAGSRAQAAPYLPSDVLLTTAGTLHGLAKCADGVARGGGPLTDTGWLNAWLGTFFADLDRSSEQPIPELHGEGWIWQPGHVGPESRPAPDPRGFGEHHASEARRGGNEGQDECADLFDRESDYSFDEVLLPVAPTSLQGILDFTNHGGQQPTLDLLLTRGDATSVPEPTSFALVGVGLLAAGLARRARRRRAATD
jgi:hypothetical protein